MDGAEITLCPPNQTTSALQVLFTSLPDQEREAMVASLAAALQDDSSACRGLFIATDHNALRGTVLVQEQPGKTALLWPPGTYPADRQLERRLAQAADAHLANSGATLAQALLLTREDPVITALELVGFRPLTELEYMIAQTGLLAAKDAPKQLLFEPYAESQRDRMAALLEATYVDTQDCPQLNGVRKTEDVLQGYQATGVFDPARWLFVSCGGEDVGVVLLTEHAGTRQWELVYMGLVPHSRGQGFGTVIVQSALARAALAGIESILLAVDVNNKRGIRLYQRCGFRAWNRRIVFWKQYT